jgi:hypothetical protein
MTADDANVRLVDHAREDDRRVNYGMALTVPQTVAGQLSAVMAVADAEREQDAATIAELRAEVERLTASLEAVRLTRDYFGEQSVENGTRAEAAEERLRAVEALRDEWSRHHRILDGAGGGLVATMTHADVVRRLDAVLAPATSPAEQEGEAHVISPGAFIETGPERWMFGQASAAALVARVAWPNEAQDAQDRWSGRLIHEPNIRAATARQARDRLESALVALAEQEGDRG